MKHFYIPALLMVTFSSCATRINYLGNSYPPTDSVAVFIDKNAVKKPYDVIGKGYVQNNIGTPSAERIQKKSIRKAQKNGADAVIIEDFFVIDNTTSIATSADSSGKNMRSIARGTTATPNFTITFIRYKEQ